jgi:hypothetical protein
VHIKNTCTPVHPPPRGPRPRPHAEAVAPQPVVDLFGGGLYAAGTTLLLLGLLGAAMTPRAYTC